ncbi:fumarylacetoacetase [Bradyrhizobium elkanii]|uniref:fumarylacetoacetase n=1 Tax=Bradyrhizobium elkanii TaxID=29448 RepID=UPI0004B3519E|nr:fumarylacetoacetase [Bradyrhizobium elkanii]
MIFELTDPKVHASMIRVNSTHDPKRRSWVEAANVSGADFPIQNLPHGVFRHRGRERGGIAIGDKILDLAECVAAGLFDNAEVAAAAEAASQSELNTYMAMGPAASSALREAVSNILSENGPGSDRLRALRHSLLLAQEEVELKLPCAIRNYTDFLTSAYHTERHGRLKGLADPLPPAFKSLPVAYHGRASSIRPSGYPVRRPSGQWKGKDRLAEFGAVRCLDFELEVGGFIGCGNELGQPIPMREARDHLFGYCLLNDWSAKDVQWWEQVLGPFLGKSFITTVSPWVVTAEALAPFRGPYPGRQPEDPDILPHLRPTVEMTMDFLELTLTAEIRSARMRAAGAAAGRVITRTSTRHLYWSFEQMVTHHASNGCNLLPGDLIGSGTVSGPEPEEMACMTEMTSAGTKPIDLGGGERRNWLEDGDEVVLRARAEREGFVSIGFGPCVGQIEPAVSWPT